MNKLKKYEKYRLNEIDREALKIYLRATIEEIEESNKRFDYIILTSMAIGTIICIYLFIKIVI